MQDTTATKEPKRSLHQMRRGKEHQNSHEGEVMKEIQSRILKRQAEREIWLEQHREELQIIYTTRFQTSYGEHDINDCSAKYKTAITVANDDVDLYLDENSFNKNDSAGRTIIKIDLEKRCGKIIDINVN